MTERERMEEHFSRLAKVYAEVRITDPAPVLFIRDTLDGMAPIKGADIGCGSGRYSMLLLQHLKELSLICVDASRPMLDELNHCLSANSFYRFESVLARVEELNFGRASLDCVFTFNAVHHFDLRTFLVRVRDALKPGGRGFIYTRTPEQNEETIWGRYFPGFLAKETRLHRLADMERWIADTRDLDLVGIKRFRYPRSSDLGRLVEQARSKHYSTFSLYGADEFCSALAAFEGNLRRGLGDSAEIRWHDANIMLQVRASAA